MPIGNRPSAHDANRAEGHGLAVSPQVEARIKKLREQLELSQQRLAARSGVNRSYLSGIESGIRNFTILHLTRIARVLKVSQGSLLDE